MATTSVILNSTDPNGKSMQTTITNVNPEADSIHLKQMGQMINGLTNNTYGSTKRVDTSICDTESKPIQATATLSLTKTDWSIATDANFGDFGFKTAVTYNGDGDVYVQNAQGADFKGYVAYDGNTLLMFVEQTEVTNPQTQTLKLKSTATDNYKAAEFQFTVTPRSV